MASQVIAVLPDEQVASTLGELSLAFESSVLRNKSCEDWGFNPHIWTCLDDLRLFLVSKDLWMLKKPYMNKRI